MTIKKLLFALSITVAGIFTTSWFLKIKNKTPLAMSEKGEEVKEHDGMEEDEGAKNSYMLRLLADPVTGLLPDDIRKKELAYAATLPVFAKSSRGDIWIARGPNNQGGRTLALGIDTDDPDMMLAGSATGGIWKTTNGGSNWTEMTAPMTNITCLSQDRRPGKTQTWYAGTGELIGGSGSVAGAYFLGDGVLKSTDGGNTWTKLTATSSGTPNSFDRDWDFVWNILTDNSNTTQDEVYAATYGSIYKSLDGGQTWKNKKSGSLSTVSYTDIAITSDGVVYASLSSEGGATTALWRSVDGETWTNITPAGFPSQFGRIAIGIAPSDENQVYFFACNTTNSGLMTTNFLKVKEWNSLWKYTYISGNGSGTGGTWEDRSLNMPKAADGDFGNLNTQGGYDLYVRIKPNDPNTVFLGATNLWRSTDGFKSTGNTTWVGGYAVNTQRPDYKLYSNHHPDQHGLVFFPDNPNKVVSIHDGGISLTEDCGAATVQWRNLSTDYVTSQFYTVAIDHGTPGDLRLIGGLQDNGTQYTNKYGMGGWNMSYNSDGSYCAMADGGNDMYMSAQSGRVVHLQVDAAGTATKYARIDPDFLNQNNYDFINPFTLDPNNQSIMYLPAKTRLFRNININSKPLSNVLDSTRWNTPLWEEMTNAEPPAPDAISAITASKLRPNTIFYGTDKGRLFKVWNANTGNPKAVNITGGSFSQGNISNICLDPSDSNNMLVVFSNYNVISLYATTNGGLQWKNVSGNLEQNANGSGTGPSCRWAAVMPIKDGKKIWLVGTSVGLYSTDTLIQNATVWVQQSPNGIGNTIVNMIDTRPQDYYVAVATHGSGMYSANIAYPWQTTAIKTPGDIGFMQVNPNPVTDVATLQLNLATTQAVSVSIIDVQGKVVFAADKQVIASGPQSLSLAFSHLPPGHYFVQLRTATGSRVEKVIKL